MAGEVRRLGFAWLGVALLACGGQSERSSPGAARGGAAGATGVSGAPSTAGAPSGAGTSGASSAGSGGAGGEELAADETLVIPLRPLDANSISLFLPPSSDADEPQPVNLALGEGYPRVVRFDFEGSYWSDENLGLLEAAPHLAVTGVTSLREGLDARRADAETFELEVHEVGDFPVSLALTWTPSDPSEPPATMFTRELMVRVRRMAGMRWAPCQDEAAVVVSGAGFRTGYVEPVDEDGATFYPDNASYARPITVSVHARPGTKLTTKDGLALLVVDGPEQRVEVLSGRGDSAHFDLIEPASIDTLRAQFFLGGDWTRGTSEIKSGSVVAAPLSRGPGRIYVVPHIEYQGRTVCSPALPAWFELTSNTPATCPTSHEPICADACYTDALPTGASALESGACQLSLNAAGLDGGRGLSTGLSLEFVEPPAN